MIEILAFIVLPAAMLITMPYEPRCDDSEHQVRQRLLRIQQRVCRCAREISVQTEAMARSMAPLVHELDRSSERLSASTARLERCMQEQGL